MALNGYGVLVGAVVDKKVESGQQTPHYQVHIRASGTEYRIAVNVRSAQNPPICCISPMKHSPIRSCPPFPASATASILWPAQRAEQRWTTSAATFSTTPRCEHCRRIMSADEPGVVEAECRQ